MIIFRGNVMVLSIFFCICNLQTFKACRDLPHVTSCTSAAWLHHLGISRQTRSVVHHGHAVAALGHPTLLAVAVLGRPQVDACPHHECVEQYSVAMVPERFVAL